MLKSKKSRSILKSAIKVKLNKRIPIKVIHFITNRCNLNCKYCYINHKDNKEMSISQIKSMLDEFYDMGTEIYGLSGGEPLIRNDIKEIVDYAKDLNLMITLATNGILVKKKIRCC